MQNNKKLIAITGGIGSGKSTVLKIIKDYGYLVIDSDKIVQDLYKKRKVLRKIKTFFPNCVDGRLVLRPNKKLIADRIFNSEKDYEKLTGYLTPLVIKQIFSIANQQKNGLIFAEVPLLFERSYQDLFDGVIVVKRELNARIESVIKRSNLTREQVLERISAQVDYDNIDLKNYTIISNDFDEQDLKQKILIEIEKIKNA